MSRLLVELFDKALPWQISRDMDRSTGNTPYVDDRPVPRLELDPGIGRNLPAIQTASPGGTSSIRRPFVPPPGSVPTGPKFRR